MHAASEAGGAPVTGGRQAQAHRPAIPAPGAGTAARPEALQPSLLQFLGATVS